MSKSWAANLERQSFDFCFNIKQCLNTKNALYLPYMREDTLFLLFFFSVNTIGPITQESFLKNMGIQLRMQVNIFCYFK